MYIDFIDKSFLYRPDVIEGAKLWHKIFNRYKNFSLKDVQTRYGDNVTGLALFDDNGICKGVAFYEFDIPYGSKDKHMIITHFIMHPDASKTYMAGKFLKRIEKVAKLYNCNAILYPDCTFNNFFEKHPDKFKMVEVIYKQEL